MMKLWAILCGKGCRNTAVLWLILFGFVSILKADPVDVEKARAVALTQLRKVTGDNVRLRSASTLDVAYEAKMENGQTAFYIINSNDGFVIVSGDDRVTPVLAYSTGLSCDPENMPPAMVALLDGYKEEISHISNADLMYEDEDLKKEWNNLKNGIISDNDNLQNERKTKVTLRNNAQYKLGNSLLKTKWGQKKPYNTKCPPFSNSCYTGCVATAMAQILRYWEYPEKGSGSHSYTHQAYGVQYADYGNTIYPYEHMPFSININSPQDEIDAVSLLMYHVGISVNMDYGVNGSLESSAMTYTESLNRGCAYDAFRSYWGYKDVKVANRNYFTNEEWLKIIKSQIDKLRPVLYKANSSSTSSHAFICDGYDEHNRLHINWGWQDQDFNAFFYLTALYAGGANYSSYTSQHLAIIDIYPTNTDFIMPPRFNGGLATSDYMKKLLPEDPEETLLDQVSVYPQLLSSDSKFTIESPGHAEVSIWDSAGKLLNIYKLTEEKTLISAPESSGYYIVEIAMGTGKNKTIHIMVR